MQQISKVGIVGAGTMGRRIAFGCVVCNKETRLFDISPSIAKRAEMVVHDLVEDYLSSDSFNKAQKNAKALSSLLSISSSLQDCVSGVDLVIETVPENIELKREVFIEIEKFVDSETLICTNTSSIPGSELAKVTRKARKVFNINFGSLKDLKVELMPNPHTDSTTMEAAIQFVKSINLIPIVVKREILGYATNRIWRSIKKEVLFLLDGGYITAEDIDRAWILDWETSKGPCAIMDEIGLDVVRDIEVVYYEDSKDPSDLPPKFLLDKIAEGKLGVKSGEGFYKYPKPAFKKPGWLMGKENE